VQNIDHLGVQYDFFQKKYKYQIFRYKNFFFDNCQKIKILVAQKIYSFIIKENINKSINLSWVLKLYGCDIKNK